MTPAGIEPATFLFVAQQLNHCATAVVVLGLQGNSEESHEHKWKIIPAKGCSRKFILS